MLKPVLDDLFDTFGQYPSFWWRDDDLVEMTPGLERLSERSLQYRVPCLLSTIAERTSKKLSDLDHHGEILQFACHGLRHQNFERWRFRASEFGPSRSESDVANDLEAAWVAMKSVFGERALPIFVPPWNRFHPKHCEVLVKSKFRGLSSFAGNHPRIVPAAIRRFDVHVDIMDWRSTPVVLDQDVIVARLSRAFRKLSPSKLFRPNAPLKPIGILTHHRVMNDAAWSIMDELFESLFQLGVRPESPRRLFGC
jgi:hypothetical protein